jgi:hypothetical protein
VTSARGKKRAKENAAQLMKAWKKSKSGSADLNTLTSALLLLWDGMHGNSLFNL